MIKNRKRISQCQNCFETLKVDENFCPKCGQENHYRGNSLKEVWNDFFTNAFNFDGRLWRTYKTLYKKPGLVPKEYIAGRKTYYANPVKLFLWVSFITMFVVYNVDFHNDKDIGEKISRNTFEIKESLNKRISTKKTSNEIIEEIIQIPDSLILNSARIKNNTFLNIAFGTENLKDFILKNRNNIDTILLHQDKSEHYLEFKIDEDNRQFAIFHKDDKKTYATRAEAEKYLTNKKSFDSMFVANNATSNFFDETLSRRLLKKQLNNIYDDTYNYKNNKSITDNFKSIFSQIFLIMVPIMAILFFIFYRKKYPNLYSHAVFIFFLNILLLPLILAAIFMSKIDTTFTSFLELPIFLLAIFLLYSNIKKFYSLGSLRAFGITFLSVFTYSIVVLILLGFTFLILIVAK